jgi:predicted ester cyclase
MSTEDNKAIIRRYKIDILNSRDIDALDEVVAADYLDHAAFPGQERGREGLKRRIRYIWDALDPQWTIHDAIAENDIVAIRWSHSGIHRGEFLGLAPTGREFILKGIDVYRVTGGLMSEHWNVVDMLGLHSQLAVAPDRVIPHE